jgi:hypothetical protein
MNLKYPSIIVSCLMFFCFVACKKQFGEGANITGTWRVATDSTFTGVGVSSMPYNYQGQPADYFDFRADGHVYIRENNVLDTFSYQLSADTNLNLTELSNGNSRSFHVSTFTMSNFVAATTKVFSPGGIIWRKISLIR